jgi:hypothetical protein
VRPLGRFCIRAADSRRAAILRDSQDPDYMSNLARLGQVDVPKQATHFSPVRRAMPLQLSLSPLNSPVSV